MLGQGKESGLTEGGDLASKENNLLFQLKITKTNSGRQLSKFGLSMVNQKMGLS